MEAGKRPLAVKVLSGLLALTGLGTAAFWVLFFAGRMDATETEQDEAFERAFPLADSWMIACALTAAKNLPRMNRKGFFAGFAAAGALLFLGLMDILYSLENGKYWPLTSDRAQMLVIHAWTAALGAASALVLWRHRDLMGEE